MITARFTKTVAGTALAAGTLGLAALFAAGTATAGTVDDQFLATLQQQGMDVKPQVAIHNAHAVCAELDQGTEPRDNSQQLVAANPGMSQQNSLLFVIDSVQAYCPQFAHHNADGSVTISPA